MRVVFFGTPQFAVPSLAALLDAGITVAGVVTQPDRPRGRSHSTLLPSPVKTLALASGIPVWQPDRPRGDEFLAQLRSAGADIGVVVAYGHLLRPDLLAVPRLGCVNVHASLLPRWRGAAPIHWALLGGDRETGVAIMRVESGLDTGAVWERRTIPIGPDDTTGSLTARLAALGAAALVETLPAIARGVAPVPQQEAGATHAPKIDREVARVRWDQNAVAVSCRIRAMDPAPGAWSTLNGAEIKLFGAGIVLTDQYDLAPGTLQPREGALLVGTRDGAVAIREVQPAGRRRVAADAWLRGSPPATDARFA